MRSTMLERVREYLRNTDPVILKKEWAEIEQMQLKGPKAFEYIQYVNNFYSVPISDCYFEEVITPENMTPKYSEFFFVISQNERSKKGRIFI